MVRHHIVRVFFSIMLAKKLSHNIVYYTVFGLLMVSRGGVSSDSRFFMLSEVGRIWKEFVSIPTELLHVQRCYRRLVLLQSDFTQVKGCCSYKEIVPFSPASHQSEILHSLILLLIPLPISKYP